MDPRGAPAPQPAINPFLDGFDKSPSFGNEPQMPAQEPRKASAMISTPFPTEPDSLSAAPSSASSGFSSSNPFAAAAAPARSSPSVARNPVGSSVGFTLVPNADNRSQISYAESIFSANTNNSFSDDDGSEADSDNDYGSDGSDLDSSDSD